MFSVKDLTLIFTEAMNTAPEGDIGIAVSGGGDSLALLVLGADWAHKRGRRVKSVTIDHGLRAGSSYECAYVKKISSALSVEHKTLKWLEKPSGNLQSSARDARHRLLSNWMLRNALSIVLLGHTLDDNAETIMIRLSRGSGIDGLTGMSHIKKFENLIIFRPLLKVSRDDLRQYLREKKISWIDEPSNLDDSFQRIKMRNLQPKLSDVGLTPNRLVALANHMTRAKEALNFEVKSFAKTYVQQRPWGDLEIEYKAFLQVPREYQVRLLSAALLWISGKVYRPRFNSLERLLDAIINQGDFQGMCLMGCIVKCDQRKVLLTREFSAVPNPMIIHKNIFVWDNRWRVKAKLEKINYAEVGPLGKDGLMQIETTTKFEVPIAALISSVAMFENGYVSCIPAIGFGSGLKCQLVNGSESFFNFLLTY